MQLIKNLATKSIKNKKIYQFQLTQKNTKMFLQRINFLMCVGLVLCMLSDGNHFISGNKLQNVGVRLANFDDDNYLENPEELGNYFEGDIILPEKNGKNGLVKEVYRWPGGVVPFEVKGDFDDEAMDIIEKAIHTYHNYTCIKFVPRTLLDEDFIAIQNSKPGCWSSVGRVGGRQVLNIQSPGCTKRIGTLIHELMHAIGFFHEQNREDRDDYVDVIYENISVGRESNFGKATNGTTDSFGVSYDYGSVMHYSRYAFSSNGEPTLIAKVETDQKIGQRKGFSVGDIEKIRQMYNCTTTTSESGYKPVIDLKSNNSIDGIWSLIL